MYFVRHTFINIGEWGFSRQHSSLWGLASARAFYRERSLSVFFMSAMRYGRSCSPFLCSLRLPRSFYVWGRDMAAMREQWMRSFPAAESGYGGSSPQFRLFPARACLRGWMRCSPHSLRFSRLPGLRSSCFFCAVGRRGSRSSTVSWCPSSSLLYLRLRAGERSRQIFPQAAAWACCMRA